LNALAVTKLDILSGLDSLLLCSSYRREGKLITDLPFGPSDLSLYEPVYELLPGWSEDVSAVRTWEKLPAAARNYLDRLTEIVGVPVRLVSVGPEREQIVVHP
jgi:adenylosuccinate synthase